MYACLLFITKKNLDTETLLWIFMDTESLLFMDTDGNSFITDTKTPLFMNTELLLWVPLKKKYYTPSFSIKDKL